MKDVLAVAARLVLGLVFGYAAITKISDMHQFAEEIANYRLLPPSIVSATAAAVVGVEIVCAVLLVIGLFVRSAAFVVTFLLVLFIAALSQALLRGINLTCGCFGGAELATWGTVARDLVLLGLTLIPLRFGSGTLALEASHSRSRTADP